MADRTSSLTPLLAPLSIALVGASENATRIGGRPLRYLRDAGFKGAIYPVNPNRDMVQGFRSYPSVASLPETPDVALLAVPASGTLQAVKDCADRKVRACIIFSAGFAETGDEGRLVQDEITATARATGTRVLGPNCLGVFNAAAGYYGTFSAILDTAFVNPGPIAVVSQSGAYGSHITHLARERGLGVGHWITTGNECDIDVAEALDWVVAQPDVNVVIAYAEGIRNGDTFLAALKTARANGKAIVFMKVGRSEVGAHAVGSHTAALAGSDAVFDAVFRQYGVYRARTTSEQLDIAYACSRGIFPTSGKLGIFTLSGGFGIQMADDAALAGLDVSPMPDAAQAKLKALLPYASPRNPVDATAQALTDLPLMTDYIRTMLDHGGYAMFAGIFGSGPATASFSAALRQALEAATADRTDCILSLTMSAPRDIVASYEDKGFLVFEDGSALTTALGALAYFRRSFDAARQEGLQHESAEKGTAAPLALGGRSLSEQASKEVLRQAGIAFPAELLVPPGGDVAAAAASIGFPVVLKISSPDIAHKTEAGGVAIGIENEAQARQAAAKILDRAHAYAPDATIEGIIVAPMIVGGVETILGVARDPAFGPVVMFGLGGIFVEVLKDVTFRVAPFGIAEAHRMIREIRGFPVLEGVRGAPAADIEALAATLSALSRFAAAHAETVDSIDLNPVLVLPRGRGVAPLDALLTPRLPQTSGTAESQGKPS